MIAGCGVRLAHGRAPLTARRDCSCLLPELLMLLLLLAARPDQLVVVETSDGEASRRWHHLRLPGHSAKLPHLSPHQHSPPLTLIMSLTVNSALLVSLERASLASLLADHYATIHSPARHK